MKHSLNIYILLSTAVYFTAIVVFIRKYVDLRKSLRNFRLNILYIKYVSETKNK